MQLYFMPPLPLDDELISTYSGYMGRFFADYYANTGVETLVVISPFISQSDLSIDSPFPQLKRIWFAWSKINRSSPGTQADSWRIIHEYGEEIAPNLGVFRLKGNTPPCFFWLSPSEDFLENQIRFADIVPKISIYWHLMQGRGFFHAAGVLHRGFSYLFVGASGAGKSTVSRLSLELGDSIFHDDHVVVYRGESGEYRVSDSGYIFQGAPLKAVLFLDQSNEDLLVPVMPVLATKWLLKSLHEYGSSILYGDVFRCAFSLCAEISRYVPSFKLYFRKSPDFWKLIDEQFPD